MLDSLTWLVEAFGMVLALWLAAYLVSHGFRSAITRGTALVLVLVASGNFFELLTYAQPAGWHNGWLTIVFTIALFGWFNVTRRMFNPRERLVQWIAALVNILGWLKVGVVALAMLRLRGTYDLTGAVLLPCCPTVYSVVDAVFRLATAVGMLLNFRSALTGGPWPYVRPLALATSLVALTVFLNIASQFLPTPLPPIIRHALLVAGMGLGGFAVARYQAFVDFRPLQRDLPTSALTAVIMVSTYGLLAAWFGAGEWVVVVVLALAVVTHAVHTLVHDGLDQLFNRHLSDFRQELRRLGRQGGTAEALPEHLQAGLVRLMRLLVSPGGFVAVRRGERYAVLASVRLLALDQQLSAEAAAATETTLRLAWEPAGADTWLVPAFAGDQQVALIGLAPRLDGIKYGQPDLDLLNDVADWVGHLAEGQAQQRQRQAELLKLAQMVERGEATLQAETQTLLTTLGSQPDREFARAVEAALQQLSDYTRLGASPLVTQLGLSGATHIERGKALRQQLLAAVESLRPAEQRPTGVLPREWQAYAILHDAYVEDLPNREIMARLYISEGTYNRMRRRALQAVAQALLEAQRAAPMRVAEAAS